jgi:hypothetical protein
VLSQAVLVLGQIAAWFLLLVESLMDFQLRALSSLIFAAAEICLECFAVHEPKSEFILFESFWCSLT